MQLGTIAPVGFSDFPPAEWLACFRELGCTVVQAYRNQAAGVTVRQMLDAIAAGGMPCDSLHGVFGEEYDPSACDDGARRFAMDTYRREGDLARQLGGSLVVAHCSTIRNEGVPEAEKRLRWDQLRRSITELGEYGQKIGVTYAFENLPGYHVIGTDVAELAAVLASLRVPRTGLCLDVGHAHMTGDPAASIRAAGRQLCYVHLSDNSGTGDDHEMPTYGTVDCDAMADALHDVGYHGTVMLEVFRTVDQLRRMLREGCAERLARILRRANGEADG
ncbi:MAG TPA: sugar phosphate isomerase/epimerase family protein [Phycisphaerae bacterium]|nr:sugar phosphate isomerase/epimerase family protein [Phycisphaerae bacterium]